MTKFTHCTLPECVGKHHAKGFCYAHYMRQYRGSPIGSATTATMYRSVDFPDGTRQCNACGERKALAEFHTAKDCRLGRRSHCRTCSRARDAARRLVVPDVYYKLDRLGYLRRRARLLAVEFDPLVTHEALRKRDGDLCHYCRRVMTFHKMRQGEARPDKASLEHVTPLSRGGGHTFGNSVLACLKCNFEKNAKTPEEWLAT